MEKVTGPMKPNLQNNWIQEILVDATVVPSRFFDWQREHDIKSVDIVPQQRFYVLVWTYHSRFKRWPPEELWEVLLEEAKNE